jgi:hypothetical protein
MGAIAAACDDEVPRPIAAASVGPIELPDGQTVGGAARRLGVEDGPRFSGIATIALEGGTCSGSFVVPPGIDLERDGPAYLLTAGHCLLGAEAAPNQIEFDVALGPRPDGVRFRHFADSPGAATVVQAERLMFATLKGVDLAIVELVPSRRALRAAGVVPFVLAETASADGDDIAYAGHPQLADPLAPAVLGACRQLRRATLVLEAQFHWWDVAVNMCQGTGPGASGSPVFALATGEVVGVLNTGVQVGEASPACAINHPCEAQPASQSVEGASYAIPVHGLGGCFDADGRFDRRRDTCPLDRDVQMQPTRGRIVLAPNPGGTVTLSEPLGARGLTHYRTLAGPADALDCRAPSGYGPVVARSDAPSLVASVAGDPGEYLLCVRAGAGADDGAGWQDAGTPTVLRITID